MHAHLIVIINKSSRLKELGKFKTLACIMELININFPHDSETPTLSYITQRLEERL